MKLISAIFGFFILVVLLIFALSNRQSVSVSLWPFDVEIGASVFILVLGSLAIGMLLGGGLIWLQHLPHRFRARRLGKDVVVLSDRVLELERELEQLRPPEPEKKTPLLIGTKWRFWERFQ